MLITRAKVQEALSFTLTSLAKVRPPSAFFAARAASSSRPWGYGLEATYTQQQHVSTSQALEQKVTKCQTAVPRCAHCVRDQSESR